MSDESDSRLDTDVSARQYRNILLVLAVIVIFGFVAHAYANASQSHQSEQMSALVESQTISNNLQIELNERLKVLIEIMLSDHSGYNSQEDSEQ